MMFDAGTIKSRGQAIRNEQENHVAREEWRYIPRRQVDPQHTPTKILPTADIFTTSSPIRGRFLLEILNSTEQLIAKGRFEIQGSNKIPATFHRCERHSNLPRVERTIIDYIIINKQHWDTVITCKIHEGSGMNIGYDAAKPEKKCLRSRTYNYHPRGPRKRYTT